MDDEFVMPDTDTLKNLTEWGNFNQSITQAGRTTHVPPEAGNDPEFDADAALAALNESDPIPERFRDLE